MSQKTPTAEAISDLIQSHEDNIAHRASLVSKYELKSFTVEEVAGVLEQISPRPKKKGSNEPCGPDFNVYVGNPIWLRIIVWTIFAVGTALLLSIQLYALLHLSILGRYRAIWKELPVPTGLLFDWSRSIYAWVKAPPHMIQMSVQHQSALCVNRDGRFALKTEGYAVLSHVWTETCGWSTETDWGPVEPEVRKQGLPYEQFLKFFDRCDAEWLWVDILAMPEIFEDMTAGEKAETEELRTGVINSLRNIYSRADKVVCLDGLLLRLRSGGMIDVAIVLCLGRWIQRLWPFTEARLAKQVLLKTEDSSFDLDAIIAFLHQTINNENHRYWPMFARLAPLRPGREQWMGLPIGADSKKRSMFVDIYDGTNNRFCDVDIDQARTLFPVLDLTWVSGWTLQQGLKHIADSYPEEQDMLIKYCEYRWIDFPFSSTEGPSVLQGS